MASGNSEWTSEDNSKPPELAPFGHSAMPRAASHPQALSIRTNKPFIEYENRANADGWANDIATSTGTSMMEGSINMTSAQARGKPVLSGQPALTSASVESDHPSIYPNPPETTGAGLSGWDFNDNTVSNDGPAQHRPAAHCIWVDGVKYVPEVIATDEEDEESEPELEWNLDYSGTDRVEVIMGEQEEVDHIPRSVLTKVLGEGYRDYDSLRIPDMDLDTLWTLICCVERYQTGQSLSFNSMACSKMSELCIAACRYGHPGLSAQCVSHMKTKSSTVSFFDNAKKVYDSDYATTDVRVAFRRAFFQHFQNCQNQAARDNGTGNVYRTWPKIVHLTSQGGKLAADIAESLYQCLLPRNFTLRAGAQTVVEALEETSWDTAGATPWKDDRGASKSDDWNTNIPHNVKSNIQTVDEATNNGSCAGYGHEWCNYGTCCYLSGTGAASVGTESTPGWPTPTSNLEAVGQDSWNPTSKAAKRQVHWNSNDVFDSLDEVGRPVAPSYEDEWGRAAVQPNINWDETVSASEVANNGLEECGEDAAIGGWETNAINEASIKSKPDTSSAIASRPPDIPVANDDPSSIPASVPFGYQQPLGWPPYHHPFGFVTSAGIGNGLTHPTAPGLYGLAGKSYIALRDSSFDCTLFFKSGDVITNVVETNPPAWTGTFPRMQGICRGRAGIFPANYIRTHMANGWDSPMMPSSTKVAPPTSTAVVKATAANKAWSNASQSQLAKKGQGWSVAKAAPAPKWRRPTVSDDSDTESLGW